MAIYVIIAVVLTIISLYSPRFNERTSRCVYILVGVILIAFISVRDFTVNRDYTVYERVYNQIPSWQVLCGSIAEFNRSVKIEFSYAALCAYLKSTSNLMRTNFIIIFFLYALVGVFVKMIAIKKLTNLHFLSLFIYFSNVFLLHECTQVRAGVAVGLILWSIVYLQKEEYYKFFLLILVAIFFHSSSFMALLLPIFKMCKADAKVWLCIFLACIVAHVANFDILKIIELIPNDFYQYKLKMYLQLQEREDFSINYFNVGYLLQNAVVILCFFYKTEMEKENPYINILLNMCCFSSCCYLFFGQIPGFAIRISEIFNSALVILIPIITYAMKPKFLGELIVYSIGWGLFLINIFYSELVQEYKTLWSY